MALNTGHYQLKSGYEIPKLGLGTFRSQPGEVQASVEAAIQAGYRHIDCAHLYNNQTEVAVAIKNKIADGTVTREDLFITTKIWNHCHRPENVQAGIDISLEQLGLDYVDLVLMHFPVAFKWTGKVENMFPKNAEGNMDIDADEAASYLNCWKKMVELKKSATYGQKLRSIGVCNFSMAKLQDLIDHSDYVPDVHQYEGHPYFQQKELFGFCSRNGIHVTSYSPLGNPGFIDSKKRILDDQEVQAIAAAHKKTAAQVLIKWAICRGASVIPKSVKAARIIENSSVFDFDLSQAEMEKISALDTNTRYLCPPWMKDQY